LLSIRYPNLPKYSMQWKDRLEFIGAVVSGIIMVKIGRIIYPVLKFNLYNRILTGRTEHHELPLWGAAIAFLAGMFLFYTLINRIKRS